MDTLKGTKEITTLYDQIEAVKSQIGNWEQDLRHEASLALIEGGATTHPRAITTNSAFKHTIEIPESFERESTPRPELQEAVQKCRDLIIQALKSELARLEAELSTYQIIKQ